MRVAPLRKSEWWALRLRIPLPAPGANISSSDRSKSARAPQDAPWYLVQLCFRAWIVRVFVRVLLGTLALIVIASFRNYRLHWVGPWTSAIASAVIAVVFIGLGFIAWGYSPNDENGDDAEAFCAFYRGSGSCVAALSLRAG